MFSLVLSCLSSYGMFSLTTVSVHFGLLAALALAGSTVQGDEGSRKVLSKQLIYQYDPITWVENLAVRPNGWILPISTTSPLLNQLDPATGKLHLVHDFSNYGNAIQGITAVRADVFAVDVLTCNIAGNLTCTPGSVTTWLVSFAYQPHPYDSHPDSANVRKVAAFPKAGFLNGMAALNSHIVLLADSYLGGIWSVNLRTSEKSLVFTDTSMNGTADIATGINGLRIRPGLLYFTNSAKGTFNRIAIDPATGKKTGKAQVFASGLAGPDDFEIDDNTGVAYVCNGALDQVLRIPVDGGKPKIVVKIPGPTSVRWGMGGSYEYFYISDVGGLLQYVNHNVTVGGAIYRVDL
jgi:hypothetical protein